MNPSMWHSMINSGHTVLRSGSPWHLALCFYRSMSMFGEIPQDVFSSSAIFFCAMHTLMQKHETSATLSQDVWSKRAGEIWSLTKVCQNILFSPTIWSIWMMMISCSVKSLLEDVKVSAMVMSISASFGLEIWKLFVSCIYHLGIMCFIISSSIDL